MEGHSGPFAVGTASAFIAVRIGTVATAVKQQAYSYVTVNGAFFFLPKTDIWICLHRAMVTCAGALWTVRL